MNEELKACPFCGGEEMEVLHLKGTIIHPHYYVKCDDCGSTGHNVKAWNTRPIEESLQKRIDEMEKVVRYGIHLTGGEGISNLNFRETETFTNLYIRLRDLNRGLQIVLKKGTENE